MSDVIHGCDAVARALRDEQITGATAFPGSPATSVGLSLERLDGVDLRWCMNENAVVTHALGRALGGNGAAAAMKHVGVNVARDALETFGVLQSLPAPLVLIEGQDARPVSSQNAQDNRPVWAGSIDMLVVAPGTFQECYDLTRTACQISRAYGMPVVIRGDVRMFKTTGTLPETETTPYKSPYAPLPGRGYAVAVSGATYPVHQRSRKAVLEHLQPFIERMAVTWEGSTERTAVVVAGHMGPKAAATVRKAGYPGMRLLVEHPLPEGRLAATLKEFDRVVVLEECLPDLELRLRALAQRAGAQVEILGRSALGDDRASGVLEGDTLNSVIETLRGLDAPTGDAGAVGTADATFETGPAEAFGREQLGAYEAALEAKPFRTFVAKDPRGALFKVLRDLGGSGRTTFVATDPGITGVLALGNNLSDVKMHMGGAVPLAAGWASGREGLSVAVVGDTNLYHSEWMGIMESAAAKDDMLVVIVDNGHSEMTAKLTPLRATPEQSIASLQALGVRTARVDGTVNDSDPWADTLRELAQGSGVRLCWVNI